MKTKISWQERIAPLAEILYKKKEPPSLHSNAAEKAAELGLSILSREVSKEFKKAGAPIKQTREYMRLVKRRQRFKKYRITEEDYQALWKEQHGVCEICKALLTESACVDHDHKTGIVRGLLCALCNKGLGQFSDNKNTLLEAANYIARHESLVERVLKAKLKQRE